MMSIPVITIKEEMKMIPIEAGTELIEITVMMTETNNTSYINPSFAGFIILYKRE
jgi:hypothetical protein